MRDIRHRWSDERGSVLVLAIFIMALLMAAGMIMIRMSASETDIAYNTVWAEGSFYAAEAALSVGIDQLGPTVVDDILMANTALGTQYTRQSNIVFLGTIPRPGYSIPTMPTYNTSGYGYYAYTVTGTGTRPEPFNPLRQSAQRQLETRAIFGPVAF